MASGKAPGDAAGKGKVEMRYDSTPGQGAESTSGVCRCRPCVPGSGIGRRIPLAGSRTRPKTVRGNKHRSHLWNCKIPRPDLNRLPAKEVSSFILSVFRVFVAWNHGAISDLCAHADPAGSVSSFALPPSCTGRGSGRGKFSCKHDNAVRFDC